MYTEKINSLSALKNPFRVLWLSGAWCSENSSFTSRHLYNIWTFINVILFGLLFTMVEISNTFFGNSTANVVDHLMLTSTIFAAIFKALVLIYNRKRVKKLFDLIQTLDNQLEIDDIQTKFMKIWKICFSIFWVTFCGYICCLNLVFIQIIFSSPEKRLYSSTHLFPNEIWRNPMIYNAVLLFEMISNGTSCLLSIGLDTHILILTYILYGHFDVLATKLSELGTRNTEHDNYAKLRELCIRYNVLLRYVDLLYHLLVVCHLI